MEEDPSSDVVENKLTPRIYQVELMNIALKQNSIIYLPTGSGKTYIAVMVLKALSKVLKGKYSEGAKLSLFLVNTVTLVPQHKKYIEDHTTLRVAGYTGEMNLDFWKKEEWEVQFDNYQVLIMTSQIMVNLLHSCFIDLHKINLLVFDECHHGVEDQPMRQIMKFFEHCTDPPRVLGLTATLLNRNCKLASVMDEVRALETTYNSKVATVDGLQEVVGFSTNPQELFKFYCTTEPSLGEQHAISQLQKAVAVLARTNCLTPIPVKTFESLTPLEPVDVLKKLRNLVTDLVIHIEKLGTFGGYKACLAYAIQIERVKKHCQDMNSLVVLNYVMTVIGWVKSMLAKTMEGFSDRDKVYACSSDCVLKLIEIMKEYKHKSNEALCALIFVKRRFTARIIHHIFDHLKKVDPDLRYLNSSFIVGNNNNPYQNTRENLYLSKKNKEVLESFINKEINVLVASNVLEEGVDIPKCTLVVKFDKYEDYRSYIQSKGRARHRSSLYYTLVATNERIKFFQKLESFRGIEALLNDFLIGKNEEREGPSATDVAQKYDEDMFAPYYVDGPDSANVNMHSAIALLARYCSSLASDAYTVYAPEWYLETIGRETRKLRVVVVLPTICPILEPIKGPFCLNKKDAKRAAALQACIMLHKVGELSDVLLPIQKDISEEDTSFLFSAWPETKEPKDGTKKNKRLHVKNIPACLKEPITEDLQCYLHVVDLKPTYTSGTDLSHAVVYNLLTAPLRFGLLSAKPLPDICTFPLFDSQGQVEVNLRVNAGIVIVTASQLVEMREFHFLIFDELLEILKPYLVIDNAGTSGEMLMVVPVEESSSGLNIRFDVVSENKMIKNKQLEPSLDDKMNLQVTTETYLHKVVSPWYRAQASIYVVTEIYFDKNPMTLFPNEDYGTFLEYYHDKHAVNIRNRNQPLLLVIGLSNQLNLFKPKGREAKRKKDKRYEEMQEYLVPELVVKQDFPASLWVQARFLPSVLWRITHLFKLHEMQTRIAVDLKLTLTYLQNPPPLELDQQLLHFMPVDIKFSTIKPDETGNSDVPAIEATRPVVQLLNKDFANKMLEAEYPWRTIDEPKDIERELDVTIVDIEHYERFISKSVTKDERLLKNSPTKTKFLPAIADAPLTFADRPLRLLSIKFTGQCPTLPDFYTAFTTAESNDIVNLERLETLGDSFLKYISSMYIYFKFPKYNEGKATALKGKVVSNRNLFYLAQQKNFGGLVKTCEFKPRDEWVPPSFTVPREIKEKIASKEWSINCLFKWNALQEEQISGIVGKDSLLEINDDENLVTNDEDSSSMFHFVNRQLVSDKSVADVVEALLGAHFQVGGVTGGIKFVEWIGMIPPDEHVEKLIMTTEINPILAKDATMANVDFYLTNWEEVEEILDYKFKNRAYLLQALTHASFSPNRITYSYERLEFIGDAILDFLITCYIYEACGKLTPGQVTDLRSALVNNNTFASLLVRCDLHKFLLMINSELQKHIDKFADYLKAKNYVIDDEVLILLEEADLNIAEYVDVPKVLGDTFEALAGAIYLDSGKDLSTVWRVFYKIMWREIEMFTKNVPINVLRRLYECTTAYPAFSKSKEIKHGKVIIALEFMCEGRKKRVHGFGSNKTAAKKAAAKIALRSLNL